jgi:hypothetical protein
MGSHLVPCPACQRHVRVSETACPFCAEALPENLRCSAPCPLPTTRLSRAALFAFRASLRGAAVVGASGVAAAATVACSSSGTGAQPLYGGTFYPVPPVTTGGSGGAGGAAAGSGGVTSNDPSNEVPLYGGTFTGVGGSGGGNGVAQVDGAVSDAGQNDASDTGADLSDSGDN